VRKLTKFELQIMEALWDRGPLCVREIQDTFTDKDRHAYTTVQTIVNRLEQKNVVRRVKKIGNAFIFEPVLTRSAAQRHVIDEFLSFFGGRLQPVFAQLVEAGQLTMDDVKEAQDLLTKLTKKRTNTGSRRR
jgi:predicted transcriptional regulator